MTSGLPQQLAAGSVNVTSWVHADASTPPPEYMLVTTLATVSSLRVQAPSLTGLAGGGVAAERTTPAREKETWPAKRVPSASPSLTFVTDAMEQQGGPARSSRTSSQTTGAVLARFAAGWVR